MKVLFFIFVCFTCGLTQVKCIQEECQSDNDCPSILRCHQGYCQGSFEKQACYKIEDCNLGMTCVERMCVYAEREPPKRVCNYNNDCTRGYKCFEGSCKVKGDLESESDESMVTFGPTESADLVTEAPEPDVNIDNIDWSIEPSVEEEESEEWAPFKKSGAFGKRCKGQYDCPYSSNCIIGYCLVPCDSHSDCKEDLKCSAGYCISQTCENDADCPNYQKCDQGSCRKREYNNSFRSASVVSSNTFGGAMPRYDEFKSTEATASCDSCADGQVCIQNKCFDLMLPLPIKLNDGLGSFKI